MTSYCIGIRATIGLSAALPNWNISTRTRSLTVSRTESRRYAARFHLRPGSQFGVIGTSLIKVWLKVQPECLDEYCFQLTDLFRKRQVPESQCWLFNDVLPVAVYGSIYHRTISSFRTVGEQYGSSTPAIGAGRQAISAFLTTGKEQTHKMRPDFIIPRALAKLWMIGWPELSRAGKNKRLLVNQYWFTYQLTRLTPTICGRRGPRRYCIPYSTP